LSQLSKLNGFLSRRKEIAHRYREALSDIEGLCFQRTPDDRDHAYHLMVAHFDPARYDRRSLFEQLQAAGIGPQVHYIPVHRQPAIRRHTETQPLPHTEHYYQGCISLPMYPALTEDQQNHVISTVRRICT
jgi:perosamine synthetase